MRPSPFLFAISVLALLLGLALLQRRQRAQRPAGAHIRLPRQLAGLLEATRIA